MAMLDTGGVCQRSVVNNARRFASLPAIAILLPVTSNASLPAVLSTSSCTSRTPPAFHTRSPCCLAASTSKPMSGAWLLVCGTLPKGKGRTSSHCA